MDLVFGISQKGPGKQIPFVCGEKIWITKEDYKYQGEMNTRFVFSSRTEELMKISTDICSFAGIPKGFLFGDTIWLYYIHNSEHHLLRIKVGGRKVQEEHIFTLEKINTSYCKAPEQIYEIEGVGLLLDFKEGLFLFRYEDKGTLLLVDKAATQYSDEKLLSIHSDEDSVESFGTLFLYGDESRGIRNAAKTGICLSWRDWLSADISGYLEKSVKECLRKNAPELLVRVDIDDSLTARDPFDYIKLEYDAATGKYRVNMMVQSNSYYFSDLQDKGITPWIWWLSIDGQTLQDEMFDEIETASFEDCDSEVEPPFVQDLLEKMYCYLMVRAMKRCEIAEKPNMEALRNRMLTWYEDIDSVTGKQIQRIAISGNALTGSHEDMEVTYIELAESTNPEEVGVRLSANRSMEKGRELLYPVKMSGIVHTDKLLPKIESMIVPLAEILNSYEQKKKYDEGNAYYDSYVAVTAKSLLSQIYAIQHYKAGESLAFWIWLEPYGFESRATVKIDLNSKTVYLKKNKDYELFEKANLPDLEQYVTVFPRSKEEYISGRPFTVNNSNGHKTRQNGYLWVEHAIGVEKGYEDTFSVTSLMDVLYDNYTLRCQTPDGKWIRHPYLRNMRAFALIPQGIIYTTEAGTFMLTTYGENVKCADVKDVVSMQYKNNEIHIDVFESFAYISEKTDLVSDLYEVTFERARVEYTTLKIPVN